MKRSTESKSGLAMGRITAYLAVIHAGMGSIPALWAVGEGEMLGIVGATGLLMFIQLVTSVLFLERFKKGIVAPPANLFSARHFISCFPFYLGGVQTTIGILVGIGVIGAVSIWSYGQATLLLTQYCIPVILSQVIGGFIICRVLIAQTREYVGRFTPSFSVECRMRMWIGQSVSFPGWYLVLVLIALLTCLWAGRIVQRSEFKHHITQMTTLVAHFAHSTSDGSAQEVREMVDNLSLPANQQIVVLSGKRVTLDDWIIKHASHITRHANGVILHPSGDKGFGWIQLGRGVTVGTIIMSPRLLPLFPDSVSVVLFVAWGGLLGLFFFVIGRRIKNYIMDRAKVIDQLPDYDHPVSFYAYTKEAGQLDHRISSICARHDEERDTQQVLIEEGRASRDKKAHVFASMSHDLKSPLNSIIGFTDLLIRGLDGELSAPQLRTVQAVAEESERLMVMIGDILDTAKLDAGRFELDRQWIPSVEILTDCEVGARRLIATREIEFISQLEPGLPPVMVDRERISRALLGLISRAVDSMERGLIRLKASRVRNWIDRGDMLKVDVIDTGRRMSDHQRNRLFNIFQATEGVSETGDVGAMGLGIALSRRIVRLHGGDVVAESIDDAQGRGSIFSVILPLDEDGDTL